MFLKQAVTDSVILALALPTLLWAGEKQDPKPAGDPGEHGIVVLDSGIAEADVEKKPYAGYVVECADLLMQHGTDRYGPVRRPLLVTILDVRSRTCPESPPEQTAHWRGQWRPCFWKPRG